MSSLKVSEHTFGRCINEGDGWVIGRNIRLNNQILRSRDKKTLGGAKMGCEVDGIKFKT